ncbi:MAG: heme NO-binding domain-containing protein [Candidatus Manganitrophus sp. SA1]|nr:heme NO-binding domain-containing protein [Candidatus Manganitrophus morganii]
MHGIIHAELKKYVDAKYGPEAWKAILKEARLENTVYLPIQTYDDADAVAIVTAASKQTHISAEVLLEDFGEFIAPDLINMYRSMIKPEWKAMELLLHTEETIHRVVRTQNPGAKPPRLRFEQTGPNQLKLYYSSERKMSAVAKGIINGVAKHYGQAVTIRERKNADGSSEMAITIS